MSLSRHSIPVFERRTALGFAFMDHFRRILLVPSLFNRLSSVFGRLQNPVLLILSSKNGRLEGLPNLLLLELEGFADFDSILVLMCFLYDNLA